MSGSLQRQKKSKRKWKRLWFLLKDKVLYTFTAREVRGHRVSHTSPKNTHTLSLSSHNKFLTNYVYFSFSLLANIFTHFSLSSWSKHFQWLMKGFSVLSLLSTSERCAAFFFLKHEILDRHKFQLTARSIHLTRMPVLDFFALVTPG